VQDANELPVAELLHVGERGIDEFVQRGGEVHCGVVAVALRDAPVVGTLAGA